MKNTATLPQAIKVLQAIEGTSLDQLQQVLGTGFLASAIRSGDLVELKKQHEKEMLQQSWSLIRRLTECKNIFITVPHDPRGYGQNDDDKNRFELRCWEGKIGYPKRGHVDGGVDLFEVLLPEQLKDCECCWKDQLMQVGLNLFNFSSEHQQGWEWVKEVKTAQDGSKYDSISLQQVRK